MGGSARRADGYAFTAAVWNRGALNLTRATLSNKTRTSPGTMLTAGELIAFAREHLPGFAVPRTVIFGPLPTTATGKIQKYELRQQAQSL